MTNDAKIAALLEIRDSLFMWHMSLHGVDALLADAGHDPASLKQYPPFVDTGAMSGNMFAGRRL